MRAFFLLGAAVVGISGVLALSIAESGQAGAQTAPHVQVGGNAQLGSFLTGPNGLTLYIFTRDTTPGESTCFDQCEVNWPPLLAGAGENPVAGPGVDGVLGIFQRPDGTRQVTLNNQPLYYWHLDTQPGDAGGQGIGGVWFIVRTSSVGEVLRLGDSPALGPVLTGPSDMTLYVFTPDTPGVSVCNGQCAINWPPLTVPAGTTPTAAPGVSAGILGTTLRDDGSTQVTLDGRPLYYWHLDEQVGDSTGHGVGNVWFALDASGTQYPFAAAETPTPGPIGTATAAPTAPSPPDTGTGHAEGGTSVGAAFLALAVLSVVVALLMGTGLAVVRRQ